MGAPRDTPKLLGQQPQIPVHEQKSVSLAALSSADEHQNEWKISETDSWDEPTEPSSENWEHSDAVLRNRLTLMFLIVVVVATSAIFAGALWQRLLLNADTLK